MAYYLMGQALRLGDSVSHANILLPLFPQIPCTFYIYLVTKGYCHIFSNIR